MKMKYIALLGLVLLSVAHADSLTISIEDVEASYQESESLEGLTPTEAYDLNDESLNNDLYTFGQPLWNVALLNSTLVGVKLDSLHSWSDRSGKGLAYY